MYIQVRQEVERHNMNKTKVDVIIPVYHPGKEFEKIIDRLEKQIYKVDHIILLHTRDGQSLENLKQKYNNIVIVEIEPEEFDHAATRDKGIRISGADIVICMTQDACPDNDRLTEELVHALDNDRIAVAYARQLPRKESTILERYTRKFNYPAESREKRKSDLKDMGIKTYFCSDVCAAYNRKKYIENGGFVEKAIFNEDMLYAAKVIQNGESIYYNAEARVIHSHNYNFMQQFHRNFDMAVSQAEHPEIFEGISSEKEGMKLVKNTMKYLVHQGKPWMIWKLFTDCVAKYSGYFLGKRYHRLPKKIILKCTMNPRYWR